MRRFFFDPLSRRGDIIVMPEDESHHVSRVLRLSTGDEIELLDGQGTVYRAAIVTSGRRVEVRIIGILESGQGMDRVVWIGQGILKGDKMDTVVQKCTELGVTRFSPLQTLRCQGRADAAQNLRRHERWQRIGLAACKQCLRPRLMQQDPPADLAGFVAGCDASLRLLFWEGEQKTHLQDITGLQGGRSVALLLGPEGGFAMEEVERARAAGWTAVSLGERILRAETATLTAVAIVQFLIGNL